MVVHLTPISIIVLQVNIWSYANHEVLHKIDIDHLENVFCTKFIEETSDEVLV